jgi:hypothetical protein
MKTWRPVDLTRSKVVKLGLSNLCESHPSLHAHLLGRNDVALQNQAQPDSKRWQAIRSTAGCFKTQKGDFKDFVLRWAVLLLEVFRAAH